MFRNETLAPATYFSDIRLAPLAAAALLGVIFGLAGLLGIDWFDTWRFEARLKEATDTIAERLSPRITGDDLRELQASAEEQMRALTQTWSRSAPEVTVTVIGSRVRVRAYTRIGTHMLERLWGEPIPIDVSGTADAPRRRSLLA